MKFFLLAILGIFILFFIFTVKMPTQFSTNFQQETKVASVISEPKPTINQQNTQNEVGSNSIRTATTQPSVQEKTESIKQPSIRSHQLGEAFSVQSDISDYNTFKWDITKTSLTKLDDYKVTNSLTPRTLTPKNGKFYIISFEGINRGNKAWYISISFADKMVLIDKNGKKYARNNSDAESAYLVYSHKYPTTDVANPDEATSVPILFDVPEQEYQLCDKDMKLFCIEGIK